MEEDFPNKLYRTLIQRLDLHVLTSLLFSKLTLPPWPMYRRNPLQWLPVQESGAEDKKSADRKPKRHAKS